MGFFSWECKGCDHSILSLYSTNRRNSWMAQAIVLDETSVVARGDYDGYGRVGGNDLMECDTDAMDCEWWHLDCWVYAGKPGFTGRSPSADDQGFFFEDWAHDCESPLVTGHPVPSPDELEELNRVCNVCGDTPVSYFGETCDECEAEDEAEDEWEDDE